MRLFAISTGLLSALLLSAFAYEFRHPGRLFVEPALAGVPLWLICLLLAIGLVVVAVDRVRR